MEKRLTYSEKVDDLYGLYLDLLQADFAVRNVASDASGTYVYLEDTEEKDPFPIVASWVGKPVPAMTLKACEKRAREAAKVAELCARRKAALEEEAQSLPGAPQRKSFFTKLFKRRLF